jgi:hypothetical protein
MTALHLIPPFVVGLIGALLGLALSLVVKVNVYVLIAVSSYAAVVLLLVVGLWPLPQLRQYNREAVRTFAIAYFVTATFAWVFVASFVLRVQIDQLKREHPELVNPS